MTWACLSIEPGSNGRIGAYCRLGTPAKRQEDMFDSFQATVGEARMQISGDDVYVEEPIALGNALFDIAARLVDTFWPGVLAYSEKLLAAAEPADVDEDVDGE